MTLHADLHWKCTTPMDKLVSVTDESIDVMLSTVFARRHFEHVRNAQQRLIRVTIYNNLPDKHSRNCHLTQDICLP